MIGADYENDFHVDLSVPQLRAIVALYEEAAANIEGVEPEVEERQTLSVFPTSSGLTALDRAIVVKGTVWGAGGHGRNTYTEALIDREGNTRVGYEPRS